jgi:hypothetical protein
MAKLTHVMTPTQDPKAALYPDAPGWWWEWTGLTDDAPEMIYVVFMGSPEGSGLAWYRGTREKMPLLGGRITRVQFFRRTAQQESTR